MPKNNKTKSRSVMKIINWIARTFSVKKDGKLMYSIQEFSNISGSPEKEIYELIKEGEIKALQIEEGGRYRIPKHEIERFVKKMKIFTSPKQTDS